MRRLFMLFLLAAAIVPGCHLHSSSSSDVASWPTDFNHDGYAEILVGAPFDDAGVAASNRGRVYLYAGGPGVDNVSDLSYNGAEDASRFGFSVAAIGDYNKDGFADFAVGAPFDDADGNTTEDTLDNGRVFIFLGGSGGFPAAPSVTLSGTEAGGHFGWSVARAGDINGDGADDLLVGAPDETGGGTARGRAYLFTGAGAVPLLTFSGGENNSRFGWSVDTAGDMNADGYFDMAVGAPRDDDDGNITEDGLNRGRVFLYLGGPSPDNSVDKVFAGVENGAEFGTSVAGLMDYNSDGLGDLAVGAPFDDGDGNTVDDGLDVGRAFVFFGGFTIDTTADRTITGAETNGQLGTLVARIGDINNGGAPDLLVGAPFDDADGNTTDSGADRGRALIFFGGPGADIIADLTLSGAEDGSHFGMTGFSGGDANANGPRDLVIGAPDDDADGNATEDGVDAGRAFWFSGGSAIDNISDLTLNGGTEAGARAGASVQ